MSDKLRHFPERDPIPVSIPPGKIQAQAELDADKAEFHARGGKIEQVGSEANRNPIFIGGGSIRVER